MTRQVRNVEHIRNLLRQMDRSVDDARTRREGTPRSGPAPQADAPQPTPAAPAPAVPQAQRIPAPQPVRPMTPMTPKPLGGANGNGNGSHAAGRSSNGAPRLKAKPKRSSPDPLQDFQQRQAS